MHSGSVAGPVIVSASVTSGNQTISASSAIISIGGGLPSASHFNLATTKFNLPGLNAIYNLTIPYTTSFRDGWTTVQGEEAFLDENGNGLFDSSYSTTACPTGYSCQCSSGSVSGPASCSSGSRSEGFIDTLKKMNSLRSHRSQSVSVRGFSKQTRDPR